MPLSKANSIGGLLGGVDTDILTKQGGIWQGSSPLGLSYDGLVLRLDGDSLALVNGGALTVDDTGNIELLGSGNIEVSGTGNIEVSGGGSIMVSGGGTVEIEDAGGRLIISSGEANAILLEGGSSVLIEAGGGIVLEGAGNIELDTGQILAALGTQALPGFAFVGDEDTGVFGFGSGQVIFTTNGVQQFIVTPGSFSGTVASAPILRNLAASSTVPNIVISSTDVNTGLGTAGADILSHIAGAIEGFRVAEVGGIITNTIFGDLISSIASGPLIKNEGATGNNPVICPSQADPDTGLTRSGVNQSSIINGGVEAFRLRATTAVVAAHSNLLFWDYDNASLNILSFGADNSAGAGFKLCRVAN
jgi:hypothetical protein